MSPPGPLSENEHPQHRARFQQRSIKPLTGEEVKANKIRLAPEKITAWWHMLRAFLIARVPELRWYYQMTRPSGNGTSHNQR